MASIWRFEPEQVLRCFILAGRKMSAWLPQAREFVMRVATENGAKSIRADGRRGWLRLFKEAVRNGEDCEVKI